MVISRVGNKGIEKQAAEELLKLAEKGITDQELESVISDYEQEQERSADAVLEARMNKEQYKKDKTQEAFNSGDGGFKRSE